MPSLACVVYRSLLLPPNTKKQVQMQALAAAQAQAQLQRQMLAQQQALIAAVPVVQAPPAAALVAAAAAGGATLATGTAVDTTVARKSREIYIGNLSIGQVSPEMLTEFFNAALAGMVPDPATEPPVINVKMDATGGGAVWNTHTTPVLCCLDNEHDHPAAST